MTIPRDPHQRLALPHRWGEILQAPVHFSASGASQGLSLATGAYDEELRVPCSRKTLKSACVTSVLEPVLPVEGGN